MQFILLTDTTNQCSSHPDPPLYLRSAEAHLLPASEEILFHQLLFLSPLLTIFQIIPPRWLKTAYCS